MITYHLHQVLCIGNGILSNFLTFDIFVHFHFGQKRPRFVIVNQHHLEDGTKPRWVRVHSPHHTPDNLAKLDLQSSGKTGIFPSPELSDLFSPYFQDFRKFLSSFLISKRHVNFLTAVQWSPRHSRRRCALGRAVQCDRCGCKEGCKTFSSLPRAVFTLSCPGFQQQAGKIWESSEMQAGQKIRLRCEPN